jgi:hypothetical protein
VVFDNANSWFRRPCGAVLEVVWLRIIAVLTIASCPTADTWNNSSGNSQWSTATNWADNSEPTWGDPVIRQSQVELSSQRKVSGGRKANGEHRQPFWKVKIIYALSYPGPSHCEWHIAARFHVRPIMRLPLVQQNSDV